MALSQFHRHLRLVVLGVGAHDILGGKDKNTKQWPESRERSVHVETVGVFLRAWFCG